MRELLVNDLRKAFVGLGSGNQSSIDEESGVPVTPKLVASWISLSMSDRCLPMETHCWKATTSMSISLAKRVSVSGLASVPPAYSLSWNSQNFPWSLAQRAASAALRALGWSWSRGKSR